MYMLRINRKAMSPLIATVILIAFAVGIGAMIMNWTTTINYSSCQDISIRPVTIGGREAICYTPDKIKIAISVDEGEIKGLKVTLIDKNLNIVNRIIEKKAVKGDIIQETIKYKIRNETKVEIRPIIEKMNKDEICTDEIVSIDPIRPC